VNCPECDAESAVVQTMSCGQFVIRSRQCRACGLSWGTEETIRTTPMRRGLGWYGRDWPQIRAAILDRDRHRCVACGKAGKLDVHHIRPLREFASHVDANHPSNLQAVCKGCHRKLDRGRAKKS
jgi:5-methylcytosine-specific restriction endonuclease McrA